MDNGFIVLGNQDIVNEITLMGKIEWVLFICCGCLLLCAVRLFFLQEFEKRKK